MNIQDFITDFSEQFDDTEPEAFKADTKFRELEEWDSFLALSIMAMVKSNYDVALTADQMRNSQTIQELFDIVTAQV